MSCQSMYTNLCGINYLYLHSCGIVLDTRNMRSQSNCHYPLTRSWSNLRSWCMRLVHWCRMLQCVSPAHGRSIHTSHCSNLVPSYTPYIGTLPMYIYHDFFLAYPSSCFVPVLFGRVIPRLRVTP